MRFLQNRNLTLKSLLIIVVDLISQNNQQNIVLIINLYNMKDTAIIQFPQMEQIKEKLDLLLAEKDKPASNNKQNLDLISSKSLSVMLDLTEQTLSNYAKHGYFKKYRLDRKIFYSISEVEEAIKNKRS